MQLGELQFGEMPHFLIRHMLSKNWRNAPHPNLFLTIKE